MAAGFFGKENSVEIITQQNFYPDHRCRAAQSLLHGAPSSRHNRWTGRGATTRVSALSAVIHPHPSSRCASRQESESSHEKRFGSVSSGWWTGSSLLCRKVGHTAGSKQAPPSANRCRIMPLFIGLLVTPFNHTRVLMSECSSDVNNNQPALFRANRYVAIYDLCLDLCVNWWL